MGLILRNGTLVDPALGMLEKGDVLVSGARIESVGGQVPEGGHEGVDCSGCLVLPGNVCAHTHLYSALARGMPAPPRAPSTFPEILELIWWRLDRALDAASIRYSALIGLLDAARAGTTSLVDHHASPNFIDGSLDIIADAFEEVGLRGVLCYEVTDRGGRERSRAGLRENVRFMNENQRDGVRGMMGAHASFTLEDDTLVELAGAAREQGTGVHIHVAEDRCDQNDSLRRSGQRVVGRLEGAGVLTPRSIAAHGVHLDRGELDSLQRVGAWLVHNCRSNLNNSVGRAPVQRFGGRAALGTDGIDGDMFAESKTAFFRAREDDLATSADRFVELLQAGAALVSESFDAPLGRLQPGSAADLIVLEYESPTPLTAGNFPWHWMFALGTDRVRDVMVGGRWIVRNRELPGLDEERIRRRAREEAHALWGRMEGL
ncbi:MAG TPA: amidohydrolase family protein [Chloroflexota bacterium]|nr:amidohydrolase family protein [Chloroflexota bacterium]